MHIAFIMDGNGRWAKKRGFARSFGHNEGASTMKRIVKESIKLGIEEVTFYAFSTENWKRSKIEVEILMKLLVSYLEKELPTMLKDNIVFRAVGNISELGEKQRKIIERVEQQTSNNTGLIMNLAVNYGSQSEIVSAVHRCLSENLEITEKSISGCLMVSAPDLIIRTGGEKRLSNFLLWQAAYAELLFVDTLWPDFDEIQYQNCIYEYQTRDRRFGGVGEN